MRILQSLESINYKFYKENYYYLYTMSIYHALVIIFRFFIPNIPTNVFYKLTFTPEATNDIINSLTTGGFLGFMWSFLLLAIILILDCIFIWIIVDEFAPKFITVRNIFIIEGSILTLSFLVPYLRDVFVFLSINTLIITGFYKLIKYEKIFIGIGFAKYIMITITYIYIIKLITYPIFNFIFLVTA